ncbi:hypothetical protein MO973_05955 [Paenibacillus sp. TRM 82003]|uniref:hypothetical protein n=1 Tax=Kineococcus sp. TRM81007 TaxID=2925831 RepID=UPI001F56535D|nr:hypothetical protein [Kineococcus sp. TRM81007]MCI2237424.1 hypothetical protein [Kineococcus sp. TRM81007]MCI3919775.1 hypothetical protein [Paenibacillus sp. TRM 82003]
MSGKSAEDYGEDYTEPELRERLKEEIKAGDKGGEPGRWSARKSQLLKHEYEEHGGGYRHPGERSESQQHLREWTEQDWRTADGSADARTGDGTKRYLPDAAWELLSEEERRATDERKRGGQEQHVANTDAAKHARAAAELIDLTAAEAAQRVRGMDGADALDRAERAEQELGKGRKTVLEAIDRRRDQL